jgi:hypothetical protein
MFFPQAGHGNNGEQDSPHCYSGVSDIESRPEYITPQPDIDKISYAAEPQPVYKIAQRPGKNQAQCQSSQKSQVPQIPEEDQNYYQAGNGDDTEKESLVSEHTEGRPGILYMHYVQPPDLGKRSSGGEVAADPFLGSNIQYQQDCYDTEEDKSVPPRYMLMRTFSILQLFSIFKLADSGRFPLLCIIQATVLYYKNSFDKLIQH